MLSRRAVNRVLRFRSENWTSAGSMLDIGTRSIFNEDHDMFRESVRRFFKERIEPFQNEWDDVGHVPRELWTEAGEMGLLGVNTSDEIGGIGGDFLSASSRMDLPSTTPLASNHRCQLGARIC